MVERKVELVSTEGEFRSFEIGWAERILRDRSIVTWKLPMGSEYEFVGGALRLRVEEEANSENASRDGNRRKDSKGKGKGKGRF